MGTRWRSRRSQVSLIKRGTGMPAPDPLEGDTMSKTRRDRVRERLPEIGADAMLVTKLVNVRYLTGFSGSAGAMLIGTEDVFFTDSRYEEQSAREVPDCRRVVPAAGQ